MRYTATAASMSDPSLNRWFSCRWDEPHDTSTGVPAISPVADTIEAKLAAEVLAWRRRRARPERRP